MRRSHFRHGIGILLLGLFFSPLIGCEEKATDPGDPADTTKTDTTDTTTTDTTKTDTTTNCLPAGYELFTDDVTVTCDGDEIVIVANGVPNHMSPYFDEADSRHAAYNGDNPQFRLNPNRIAEQNMTFRIPKNPQLDPNHEATPLGPIGISLNGVPFFNQYAAMRAPLTNEINSFDQYNGHPAQAGQYHYHIEPLYLTETEGKDGLLGFLLDGYPVYGPLENGTTLSSDDLDDYHGHEGTTADYPEGIYHYHITADDPYLNGAGFYGLPGTVSR